MAPLSAAADLAVGGCDGVLPAQVARVPIGNEGRPVSPQLPSRKRPRVEDASTLDALFRIALPEKAALHHEWLRALADPAVCVQSLEDVRRLDAEDIAGLPVPALVKSVLRDVLAKAAARRGEHQAVLEATAARRKEFLSRQRDHRMQPPQAGSRYFQEKHRYRLILTHEEIEVGVRLVAHRIEKWAKGERVVLVGILKGAFMFVSDLCRALVRPYSVFFVEASSYKDARVQSGLQISADLAGTKFLDATTRKPHKIVLIDELLDNGKTMQEMKQYFLGQLSETHTDNDILTVCLFSKQRPREYPDADITGISNLPDIWLVGYGLDDRGTKRGWTELFAIPKVKIVETNDKEEVDRLLQVLDDGAMVTEPHTFADFELTCNQKQKYRVSGLDAQGAHKSSSLHMDSTRITRKADLLRMLAGLPTVKGKYEWELMFSFNQENVTLVPEDEIFAGNNQIYANMRSRLRDHISASAARFGLPGLGQMSGTTCQPSRTLGIPSNAWTPILQAVAPPGPPPVLTL